MTLFSTLLQQSKPLCAPLVLDPMMAKLAESAGFQALYLGGGALGYQRVFLEANLTLTEMAHAALEIKAASELPLIFDAAAGWGDPMHMVRTIAMAEAAGFAAIEIEDQILPKRAHHHIGIDHVVPMDFMVAKIEEAARARRNSKLHIIARTIAHRSIGMDEAIRRCEAYRSAGADSVMLFPYTPEQVRYIGERLEPPLATILRPGGMACLDMTIDDIHACGFRLLIDPATPLLASYEAMRGVYHELARDFSVRSKSQTEWARLQKEQHATIEIDRLIEIEKRTTEKNDRAGVAT